MAKINLDNSSYDLSSLRPSRPVITYTTSASNPTPEADAEGSQSVEPSGQPAAPSSPSSPTPGVSSREATKRSGRQAAPEAENNDEIDLEKHSTVVGLARFFADGRLRIFIGLLLILIAGLMLAASISYLSTGEADQSIVASRSASEISLNHEGVRNTAGWLGALVSYFLIYRWLGLGGFIVIFYIGALGVSIVRLHRFKFWQLTFKSLVAAIAVSVILGFLTYNSVSPTYWGGEHGYYFNEMVIGAASYWGGAAVSIAMGAALVLIFAHPIRKAIRSIRRGVNARRNALSERYRKSMAAARAALEKEKGGVVADKTPGGDRHDSNGADGQEAAADTHTAEPVAIEDGQPTQPEFAEFVRRGSRGEEEARERRPELEDIPEVITVDSGTSDCRSGVEEPGDDDVVAVEVTRADDIEEAYHPDENADISLYDPTAELGHYRFPELELLHHRDGNYTLSEAEQEENIQRIVTTLSTYGIGIDSIKATVGPTITLYEIVPEKGVRIASIKRLGDDMTMSLAATGIRIIAPMPGKGTIGMEVPNKKPQVVSIRSILSSKAYHESTAELPIAMGSTIDNQVYVTDLAKMPHLLVAGATGMGKSVGLNTIIASLLYKKHPAELKFVLVDPKMVEFSLYKSLEKHFLAKLPEEEDAIITDPLKVVATLNSLCIEMDNRYALLSDAKLRGIKEYNQKFISRRLNPEKGHRYLPYIVVIIDEFADLILTAGKEVETPISRIAAKARAVGIHMIIATQRPSVKVITGVIKANFPGRMAFRVTQRNDSQTILDRPGADQLIGRGDMLISRDGVIDRVQCAFIDTDEVEAICQYISEQIGYSTPYELPEAMAAEGSGEGLRGNASDRDPMFADAARAVIEAGMGSASLLQRKFNIGYPRAGKLIDQLEAAGVVGAATGLGKPRAVLMDLYSFERSLAD